MVRGKIFFFKHKFSFEISPRSVLQKYFQSGDSAGQESELLIEWTNQHGCGGNQDNDPHKLNCNLVLQYMVLDGNFNGNQEGVCRSMHAHVHATLAIHYVHACVHATPLL